MGANAVKLVYLAALALLTGWIAYSGRAELYIHPRFVPALAATAWTLAALALFQAARIVRERRDVFSAWRFPDGRRFLQPLAAGARYGLLTLPILFALLPGAQVLGGDHAAHRSLRHAHAEEAPAGGGFFSDLQAHFHHPELSWFGGARQPQTAQEGMPAAQEGAPVEQGDAPAAREGAPAKTEPILFDEKNFLPILLEINQDPGKFAGRPVEISGFLVDAPAGGEGLYIGRYVVNCCVADTVIMGLAVENTERWMKGEDKIKVGDWVKGTGVFQKARKPGTPGGLIVSLKGMVVETPPRNPYIYAE
ncbi:TIGR03943 family protein [Heliobacterium undosum]|uniref:TIGR03943 family protein n=1 Tax=Heliomicrobium undosum TaxID=121734 RepID=A0A845KZS9_9FIRM|nr:TIGR03943 family protein [Heliomicrobium undosum]MZP29627.1 TIGR03943 family protein [Heliomicrobium undosum]